MLGFGRKRFMKKLLLTIVLCLLIVSGAYASRTYDVVIRCADENQLRQVYGFGLSLDDRKGLNLFAQVETWEIQRLENLGFDVRVLGPTDSKPKAGYHTPETMGQDLQTLADTYPDQTELVSLGKSVRNRDIWVIKITGDVNSSKPKPRVLLDASIHGDEQIGMEVAYNFAKKLLESYGSIQEITDLLDAREIWIVPIVNPDGVARFTRVNANSIDLNRDYGFFWEEGWASNLPASQPETKALMQLAFDNNFIFAISYHAGATLVNYPWDTRPQASPDEPIFIYISEQYGDLANYSVTNGWDWYETHGISEESYYGSNGSLAVIVELSNIKTPPAAQIPNFFNRNWPALIHWADMAGWGVHGTVTDAISGAPIAALMAVLEGGWQVYSDPNSGSFFRFLEPGTYTLAAWANGYEPATIDINVPAQGSVEADFTLTPATGDVMYAAYKVVLSKLADPQDSLVNQTLPNSALGLRDGKAFSLGPGGFVGLDMGPSTPIVDQDGPDFTVVEIETDGKEGYSVMVADDWKGPWTSCGSGSGTQDFDLASCGVASARFVMIVDDGDGPANQLNAGADIDAVEFRPACTQPQPDFSAAPTSGPAPLDVNFTAVINAPPGCISAIEWDFGDGNTEADVYQVTHTYADPGTYTVSLTAQGAGGEGVKTKTDLIVVMSDDDSTDDDNDTGADDDAGDDAADDDIAADDDLGGDDSGSPEPGNEAGSSGSNGCGC